MIQKPFLISGLEFEPLSPFQGTDGDGSSDSAKSINVDFSGFAETFIDRNNSILPGEIGLGMDGTERRNGVSQNQSP